MSAAVIESFADKRTAAIYKGIAVRSLKDPLILYMKNIL